MLDDRRDRSVDVEQHGSALRIRAQGRERLRQERRSHGS